jgi:antitoxin MazE
MKKKLVQVGNSLALLIDKPILELIGIDASTELELGYDGEQMTLKPVRAQPGISNVFRQSVAATIRKHRKTFEKLAKAPAPSQPPTT